MVEAQHRVSTLKLVESLSEQRLLEDILDESKPAVPIACRGLHYLLSTPFRYDAVYPHGSRFRRSGRTEGVYYASESARTAAAEIAFYRLLFFIESPATPWPANAAEYTAFAVPYSGGGIDLTQPPLSRQRKDWTQPIDYGPCQKIADTSRKAGVDIIRYESVRDAEQGANVAILKCGVFGAKAPRTRQTWRFDLGVYGIRALCEFPALRIEFRRDSFNNDARVAAFDWNRDRA